MIRSFYNAVSSMITMENKQNTIVNNMSNANTTGYKSQELETESFQDVLIQNRDKLAGTMNVPQTIGSLNLGVKVNTVVTKFTQGDLRATDNQTDFGINGRGFFAIQKGNQTVFTRDGGFTVGNNGNLLTTTGDTVLSTTNQPIYVGDSKFTLGANNTINVPGQAPQTILTADFADYTKLKKIGDNYYTGDSPIYNAKVDVKQNYLEASNVNVTNEMVNMLTTMRNFETNQKVVSMIDETLNKAANEVGTARG